MQLVRRRTAWSPAMRRRIVATLVLRDGPNCANCNKPFNDPHNKFQIGHITAFSEGGSDDVDNLHLVHHKCNVEESPKGKPNPRPIGARRDWNQTLQLVADNMRYYGIIK